MIRDIGICLAAPATAVHAQPEAFPVRPLTLVAPVSSGGQGDIIARHVAQKLADNLGQPVVVENRAGANTMLATRAVAHAPADGYTLLLNFTVIVQNPLLYEGKAGYDVNDLRPVGMVGTNGVALAVGPASTAQTLKEFVALARSSGRPLTYATVGHGSSAHLYMVMFAKQAGVELAHVPYKGESQFIPDLIAGRIDAGLISPMSVRQLAVDGKVRPLATTGKKRNIALPDVPTFVEQGIKGMDEDAWAGIFAPARTPQAVVDRLSRELSRAVLDPSVSAKLAALGVEPTGLPADDFAQVVQRSASSWKRVIAASGITLKE